MILRANSPRQAMQEISTQLSNTLLFGIGAKKISSSTPTTPEPSPKGRVESAIFESYVTPPRANRKKNDSKSHRLSGKLEL